MRYSGIPSNVPVDWLYLLYLLYSSDDVNVQYDSK